MKKRAHQTSKPSPLRNRPCRTYPAFFAFTFAIRSSSTGAKGNCREARRLPFWMATDPIGKDEPIGDFESQQQNENQKVKVVNIVGLGGSGKHILFGCLLFEITSFLFDLLNASNRNALPDLQCKFLQDVLYLQDCKVDSVNESEEVKHRVDVNFSTMLKEKQIFLDVACFFLRDAACEESLCRLWNESQASNLHKQQKAVKEFNHIMAATINFKTHDPPLEEMELSALNIFAIEGDCFDEQISKRFKNLAWLRWFECSHINISYKHFFLADLNGNSKSGCCVINRFI